MEGEHLIENEREKREESGSVGHYISCVWLAGRREKRRERRRRRRRWWGRVKSESESHEWTQQVPQSDSTLSLRSFIWNNSTTIWLLILNYVQEFVGPRKWIRMTHLNFSLTPLTRWLLGKRLHSYRVPTNFSLLCLFREISSIGRAEFGRANNVTLGLDYCIKGGICQLTGECHSQHFKLVPIPTQVRLFIQRV